VNRFIDSTGVPDDQASHIGVAMRDAIEPLDQLIRCNNVASDSCRGLLRAR